MILVITTELIVLWILRKFFANNLILVLIRLFKSPAAAVWIYSVLTLPGLLAHEIAHFLTAALLGLRTGSIELLPVLTESGSVEFGSVQVEKADPLRLALVGLAPLAAGLPLIAWISLQLTTFPLVWGYLLVCITAHVLPSKKDLTYWPVAILIIGLFGWLVTFQLKNDFLVFSIVRGLLIPMAVLAGGTMLFFGLNHAFRRRKIVQ